MKPSNMREVKRSTDPLSGVVPAKAGTQLFFNDADKKAAGTLHGQ